MQATVSVSDLRRSLADANIPEHSEIILQKCVAMCQKYNTQPEEFARIVDSFLMNKSATTLSIETMGSLEQDIQKHSKNAKNTSSGSKPPLSKRPADNMSPAMSYGGKKQLIRSPDVSNTMSDWQSSPGMTSSPGEGSVSSYSIRTDKGKVIVTHNEALESKESNGSSNPGRAKFSTNPEIFENITNSYRYMFTPLAERASALEKHLLDVQSHMCKVANLDEADLQPVGIPSPEQVWCCGRIACDAAEGRINSASIILEGSRRDSGGRRVALDLKEINAYSLFPGQIVLVEGVNSSGRRMVAKNIVEGIPLPQRKTNPAKLLQYHHTQQEGQPVSIMVATGPFTTSDSLSYEPFNDILGRAFVSKPDVLVLMGPFVDTTHPIIAEGDVTMERIDNAGNAVEYFATYEDVFLKKIVLDGLNTFFDSETGLGTTNIVVVPSLQDAHHDFVFPQPPFKKAFLPEISKDSQVLDRIHFMPNPCVFSVNETVVGITTNDVLFALSSDEVSHNIGANRLPRLAGHLLQQHSFCPQFPTPPSSFSQLDMRQSRHWKLKCSPDILITPSKITPLAKEVLGSLVVNPGPLTKGTAGGTYAEITIHPISESQIREALLNNVHSMDHNIPARTKVVVKKI